MQCPRCGSENAEEMRFCGSCGAPLARSTPERRQITVMFCDLVGSTSLAERLDPEEFRQVLRSYQETGVEVVTRFGGYVARYIGDGLLIYFGYPQAHGDDAQRAVHTALGIVEAIQHLDARLRQEKGFGLAVRIGVHTGLVVVGEMGGGPRREPIAVGETPHLAARLQGLAEPNTVVIGADTHRLVQEQFDCQSIGARNLRGISHPVLAYRVLSTRPEPVQVHGLATRGLHSPLVGRDAEYAEISDCIERLLDGQGGIISITGEAGVGKSRLVAEIRGDAPLDRLHWLEGRALSFGQTISYWPFQEILKAYAGISEEDSERTAWDKLEYEVTALFPDQVAETLPYLASLLGLEVRGEYAERVEYLDGEAMGRQIYLTSRRFFERLAQERPVVLVFEDLHWADRSSAELLAHLMPLVERVPLLIVGVSRPYRETPSARLQEVAGRDLPDRYSEIHLTPLSRADSAQLVRHLLEIEDLSPGWREAILSKAEGNPFFVEEVLRSLIDAGVVVRDEAGGRWRATAQVEEIIIPDTIQGVIIARVDRLEEDVRQVLRVASVIGRSFLYRVLRAIAEADRELDRHLDELQTVELIREKRRLPELEYIFKHALAQEAVYESLLIQRRRELHAQVGACIEALFPDRLEPFYGLLAYHYARVEDWEKAQEYLFKAGDQAGQIAADAEALAHYERAIAAYARAFGNRWDPVQRASLERKMGEALFRQGNHQQGIEYFQRALNYLDKSLPVSRWEIRLAILREVIQQFGHRLVPGLFIKPDTGPVDPAVEDEARICFSLGWIDVVADQQRLMWDVLRLLNISEQSGFLLGIVQGYTGVETIADFFAIFRIAEYYGRRAVDMAEQMQHPDALGMAYQCLATHESYLAKQETAIEYGRRSAKAYLQTGYLRGWGVASFIVSHTLAAQGNFAQAFEHSQDIVRLGQDGGDLQVQCWGLTFLASAQRYMGQIDQAMAALKVAISLADELPDYLSRVRAGGELGRCYLQQGELGKALELLEEGQRLAVEHTVRAIFLTPLRNGLAEAYLLATEQSDTLQEGDWLKKARRACRAALKHGEAFRGGLPEAMTLQGRYEWLRGKPAAAQKWWRRSLALAEELGQPYDLGMTYLETGRRLGERAHLERAEAILTEIGAEWDLAQARELLKQVA